jgi:hypothetical protein
MRARSIGVAVLLASVLCGTPAFAQDSANAAAAQALYDKATQEMDRKDFASACPRLEEVVRLIPDGVGARVTLGQCYEGLGKLASAWSAYAAAEATAQRLGQNDRAAKAHETAERLRPRLATLTVVVPESLRDAPGLVVKRDGTEVGRATWGVAIPVDRGSHTVAVSATGKLDWSKTIDVDAEGKSVTLTVELPANAAQPVSPAPVAPAPVAPPPIAPAPVAPPPVDKAKTPVPAFAIAGFAIGGAGVVVGAVTGGLTLAKDCKSNTCTASDLSAAKTLAWVSDIGFGVGLAGAVVGIVGLVTAGPKPAASAYRVRVAPGGLWFEGAF